jgi:predicted PurR-regulated permease PerM
MINAAGAVVAAMIIAALYFGRDVFIPLALAILLSFVLAPLVRFLQRARLPRGLAVLLVVFSAFASIFALGAVIASQVGQLAGDLPRYQTTLHDKIESLRGTSAASGTLERAADVLQDLNKELNAPKPNTLVVPPGESKPIPVEVRQPPPSALENLAALISPLLHPLTTTGIVALFVVFILMQREDLRNRFIKLAGSHDLQKTTAALDEAARRLSRLFLFQLALNSAFGILVGLGLWIIGVPSPILWGILAAILRFVPYVGAVISAVFPMIIAAAVDPGWTMLLGTAALFFVVEPIVGQVLEPLIQGRSAGLSPAAVVASATFWTALWGPIGLVVATPLTVCLVVLGRYVDSFRFLEVMLSNRPALTPPELFYQRVLAGDPAEAVEKAEEFLKERPLSSYYDEVALPGLKLAQNDVARGALEPPQVDKIRAAAIDIIEDLEDASDENPKPKPTKDAEAAAAVEATPEMTPTAPTLSRDQLIPEWQASTPVLCVAGRGPLDEAISAMLAQLLEKHGLASRLAGAAAITNANVPALETDGVALVCLSYLDTSSPAHMRYAIRRVRRRFPRAVVLLGSWMAEPGASELCDLVKADAAVTSVREALRICVRLASGADAQPDRSAEEPLRVDAA